MALKNKLGISDSAALAKEEERISKEKAIFLFESGKINTLQPGTYAALAEIHRTLFEDIFDFAGQLRQVNIAKGNFRFAPALYLSSALQQIEAMPQSNFEQIVEKYVEMNVAHPFREGNGRSLRLWLDLLLKAELGLVVDWSKVDKEDYLMAMERSPFKDLEIKTLLRAALTADVTNREIFMKGLDRSYDYEGYSSFRAADLAQKREPPVISLSPSKLSDRIAAAEVEAVRRNTDRAAPALSEPAEER